MALFIAGILFIAFFANVMLGAFNGAPILNDVQEMLLLFAASVAFVIAILKSEAQAKAKDNDTH